MLAADFSVPRRTIPQAPGEEGQQGHQRHRYVLRSLSTRGCVSEGHPPMSLMTRPHPCPPLLSPLESAPRRSRVQPSLQPPTIRGTLEVFSSPWLVNIRPGSSKRFLEAVRTAARLSHGDAGTRNVPVLTAQPYRQFAPAMTLSFLAVPERTDYISCFSGAEPAH